MTPPFTRRELTALAGLFCIGCAMLVLVAAGPWIARTHGYLRFTVAAIASGCLTIVATRLSAAAPARIGLVIVFGFALAMRLLLAFEEPLLSTDLYRYVWDGR